MQLMWLHPNVPHTDQPEIVRAKNPSVWVDSIFIPCCSTHGGRHATLAIAIAIAIAIIAAASLSVRGLGQQPPAPSWGSMLNAAQRFLT